VTPFEDLLQFQPVTLIIRHAERYSLKDVNHPDEAMLTEKGRADALEYGRSLLPFSPVMVYHSPVERCADTARRIVQGLRDEGGDAEVGGKLEELGGAYLREDLESRSAIVIK
jgi:broad specificity phosphatase PhoE